MKNYNIQLIRKHYEKASAILHKLAYHDQDKKLDIKKINKAMKLVEKKEEDYFKILEIFRQVFKIN
jgi:hypothetical protein